MNRDFSKENREDLYSVKEMFLQVYKSQIGWYNIKIQV